MKTEPLSACIIGVSGFGSVHYNDLMREVEAGRMRALGATVRKQVKEKEKCERLRSLGCELFTDYGKMLEKLKGRVDLCFVPTAIHVHAPMSIDAMRAGADVLVEKPVAAIVQDVHRMQACERETGRFVAVGYQHMYASATARVKNMILAREIGPVRTVKCRALWPRPRSYYERNSWAGRLKAGADWVLDSPFNNALAHYLNLMCFFAGRERERSAEIESVEAELYRANDIESADTACLRIAAAGGVKLCFYVTHACEKTLDPEIVVIGEKGSIALTKEGARLTRADGSSEEIPTETGTDIRDRILGHLRRRVSDRRSFVCDLEIAGTQTVCANAAHESSAIRTVDPSYVSRTPRKDSTVTVIAGIDEVFARAFEEEKLFSEISVPWARAGKPVRTEGYAGFRGPPRG